MHSFFHQGAELGSLISKRKDQKKREKQMAKCIFLVLFIRNPLKSRWSLYLLSNCSVWHRAVTTEGQALIYQIQNLPSSVTVSFPSFPSYILKINFFYCDMGQKLYFLLKIIERGKIKNLGFPMVYKERHTKRDRIFSNTSCIYSASMKPP